MAFRDDRQRGQVCWMLCSWIPTSPWELTETGYRPKSGIARPYLPAGCSSGEAAMIRFSMALWSGDDLVIHLGWDSKRMVQALTAIIAMHSGPEAVDEWLRAQAREKMAASPMGCGGVVDALGLYDCELPRGHEPPCR